MRAAEHVRILHLEDRALDAEMIQRELKRAKLDFSSNRVETESTFRDALESSDPDVILADFNLPGFDGMEALKIAQEVVPDTPFIFVSGSIGEERAVQALLEGAVDYVSKDRPARLPSAILRAIDGRRERQQRIRGQEALKRSEERYKHAANATQEIILDWNLHSNKVSFNDSLRALWGHQIEVDEVSIDWIFEKIHPDEREEIEQAKRVAIESSERWEGSFRFRSANGSYGHVLERSVVVRDGSGRPQRMICAMLDITEQKVTEELMRSSERRFRSLAQTATDAIVITDSNGQMVFVNETGRSYFSYPLGELLGFSVTMLIPERNRGDWTAGLKEIVATGTGLMMHGIRRVQGQRQDGSEFPLEVAMSTWKIDEDSFFTFFFRDACELVARERRQKMELTVAKVLFDASSTEEGIFRLLQGLGTELGWKVGAYWCVENDGHTLRCDDSWSAEGFDGKPFFEASFEMKLRPEEGIPGQVFATGKTLVIESPGDHPGFLRGVPAATAGLLGGFAFPIIESSGVTGVLEFYDDKPLQPHDGTLIRAMNDVGRRIGSFLQRGRAEEALKASKASLLEAQRLARVGSFSFHVPTGTVEWSEEIYRIFGVNPAEFVPSVESYLALVHPEDLDEVVESVSPPYPAEFSFQHRIVREDGSIRTITCRSRILEGTATNAVRLFGTIQDITERVEAQETIQRLGKHNQAVLDSMTEAIVGEDMNGRVTFANPAATAITGYTREEFLNCSSLYELLKLSDENGASLPPEACPVYQTIADGKTRTGSAAFRKKSGELFPVEFATSAMIMDGGLMGSVLSFTDITEKQKLERRLEQANRVSSLGRVATTIAHEFSNVLMGIQPFADLIQRRPGSDEKTKMAASQILTSVARGKRVTQEILRFTQPAPPAFTPTPVRDWLEAVLPELSGLAGERMEIRLDLPEEPVGVLCDVSQLQQVITNLVLNARDAMGGKGSIVISVNANPERKSWPFGVVPEGMVVVSVADTGEGMPAAVMAKIFEPMFTTKRSGTGLGLAVAHQILAAHQGAIHVNSSPGEGTTFYLLLPRADGKSEPLKAQSHPSTPAISAVLVVDDDLAFAKALADLLAMENVAVSLVHQGKDVIESLTSKLPDLIFLDVHLPDINGLEVLRSVAERWPELPVLLSTGDPDDEELDRNLPPGRVGFLRKPFNRDTLLNAMNGVVARSGVVSG